MNLKFCFKSLFSFKKSFAAFLTITLLLSVASLIVRPIETEAGSQVVAVYVNKKKVKIQTKYSAKRVGKVVIAPAKQLAKALKAKYTFSKASKNVVIKKQSKNVTLTINSKKAKLGKKIFKLRKPVSLTKGMPMVDAVNVAKKLGFKYSKYVAGKRALYIASKKSNLPGQKKEDEEYDEPVATSTPELKPTPKPTFSIDPNAGADTYRKTGLPVVFINTDNGRDPTKRGVYQDGMMCIEETGAGGVKLLENIAIEIAVRGNSTSGAPKKPYKFKFIDNADGTANKKEVLGMSAHHKWNLLANYYDKSLLRNAVALHFAEQLDGLDYTPDFRYVEVVLNGRHVGNYMVTEKVEIADNRVNIKKNTTEGLYGYIIENDGRSPDFEIPGIGNEGSMKMAFKDPDSDDLAEDGSNARRDFIQNDITTTWKNIYASTTYDQVTQYIDIDSFVDYHILQDFAMPVDGYFSSIEMYKDCEGDRKLHMGPGWDYDLAFGNSNPGEVSKLCFRWADYLSPVFNIAKCRSLRTQRWNDYAKAKAEEMITYLDETAAYIKKSAELNNTIWPLSSNSYYRGAIVHNNNDDEVAYFRSQLQERIKFVNKQFNTGWY